LKLASSRDLPSRLENLNNDAAVARTRRHRAPAVASLGLNDKERAPRALGDLQSVYLAMRRSPDSMLDG